jgi:hypothetical protein
LKENYLKIIFVLDESGSMQGTESDVIGGFNKFLEQQKSQAFQKSSVSLYKFNDDSNRVFHNLPLDKVRPLQAQDYSPGGLTTLYDAIGLAISEADKQNSQARSAKETENKPESKSETKSRTKSVSGSESKPDVVLMLIITDGQENASREYDSQQLKRMIQEHEQNENWQFVYLGTDLSNFADAGALGFKYKASSYKVNLQQKFSVVSEHAILFKSGDLKKNKEQLMSDFVAELEDN